MFLTLYSMCSLLVLIDATTSSVHRSSQAFLLSLSHYASFTLNLAYLMTVSLPFLSLNLGLKLLTLSLSDSHETPPRLPTIMEVKVKKKKKIGYAHTWNIINQAQTRTITTNQTHFEQRPKETC